jgi:hypothetical protein
LERQISQTKKQKGKALKDVHKEGLIIGAEDRIIEIEVGRIRIISIVVVKELISKIKYRIYQPKRLLRWSQILLKVEVCQSIGRPEEREKKDVRLDLDENGKMFQTSC